MKTKIFLVFLVSILILPLTVLAGTYPIEWNPRKVEETIELEDTKYLTVTFTNNSETTFNDLTLWTVPELKPFVSVEPASFSTVDPHISYDVTLHISSGTQSGLYEGTVHPRTGTKTNARPLPIELNIVDALAVIGPQGGVVEVNNPTSPIYGTKIDIPAGAVDETTVIKVMDLPLDQVNTILSARDFASHEKRCIGGFVAKPDLEFRSPITAILPVLPLEPGEIPVQIEVDLDEQMYWIPKMNLRYLVDQGLVEMEIQSFSGKAVAGLNPRVTNELCTDPRYNPHLQICEDLDCLQPACCLLATEDRPVPGDPNFPCECCRELGVETRLEEALATPSDDCQIAGEEMVVFYPNCPLSPPDSDCPNPQRRRIGETAPDCPKGMTFEVKIIPENPQIYVCQEASLNAEITGFDENGIVLFTQEMITWWEFDPADTKIAEFTYLGPFGESKILGLQEGMVTIKAISPDPNKYKETTLEVMKPELDIITEDGDFLMDVGDEETWDALCVTCPAGEVVWDTNQPDVVELTQLAGDAVRVKAISKGIAQIRANFICGVPKPVEYVATLLVEEECPEIGDFYTSPVLLNLWIDEHWTLTATVEDVNGDP